MPKTTNPMAKRSGASTNIILTAIVLVVAVAVIGGVVYFGGNNTDNGASSGDKVASSVLNPEGSHQVLEGGQGAPTLVEFVDYQCPACHSFYQSTTSKLEKEYEGKINFVVRNNPLDMHPLAQPAAKAAEAAAMQGEFKSMYHKLFDNYSSWAVSANGGNNVSSDEQRAQRQFAEYAEQIGLDTEKFREDMNSDQVQQRIDKDLADGQQAGVTGTPAFFLDGERVQFSQGGTSPLQQLRDKLDGELAK
ncbi:Protein-disulfide isomerase [Actinopolyspora xinjiangensis]|uniref:Protein-disulfide isomerase n=1 Tax=Actinopolyspora xinjiangensis TaxID=405564 RepID=A0A1H0SLD3_9ACTN|nr:thioredoxin domain-containing protein [Actinopolyspora xinjiangensis]SDP42543.1 Protein-disulfide isomerase [Actinopolyspora xinjiangensis]